jgi:hypothetical protein
MADAANPITIIDMSPTQAPIGVEEYIRLVKTSVVFETVDYADYQDMYYKLDLKINQYTFHCCVLCYKTSCHTFFIGKNVNIDEIVPEDIEVFIDSKGGKFFMRLDTKGHGSIKTRGIDFEQIEDISSIKMEALGKKIEELDKKRGELETKKLKIKEKEKDEKARIAEMRKTAIRNRNIRNIEAEIETFNNELKDIKDGKKNRLDTIFYLQTFFYKMIGIDTIYMSDKATFSCQDGEKYNSLLYRIFATVKPLHELCIYQKYFKHVTRDETKNTEEKYREVLEKYREQEYQPIGSKKSIKIYDYFKDFKDTKECKTKALELKELGKTMMGLRPFLNLYNYLSNFSAQTTDSIYWPEAASVFKPKRRSARTLKKKSKSRNKRSRRAQRV